MTTEANDILNRYIAGELTGADKYAALLPPGQECSELLVTCHPDNFSPSAIARAVEDCDSRLLAMTVTAMRDANDRPVIMLRVESRVPQSVMRSLARYGYDTIHTRSDILPAQDHAEAMARVNELLHYLEM